MRCDQRRWGPKEGWLEDMGLESLYLEFSALHAIWSSTAWEQEKLMVEREELRRINQLNPRTDGFEYGKRHNVFLELVQDRVPRPWVVRAGDDAVGMEWDDVVRARIDEDLAMRHLQH